MKLYRGSMQKLGSSPVEDIPAIQGDEGLLHFQWLDRNLNAVEDHLFKSEVFPSATLLLYLVVWQSSLMKEEPDASTPFQVFEDMLEDNISSRTGNLIVPDLGADVMSDVTSSSGPVKLEDLQ
ncbi:26S proteasome regulatory subunit RPN13 isoform X1 [Populus trichocarpa]|uniref:26S proteasome regulatory subunit RPN13 isoform X1 n=1 Tax=Populus trichocarpa TaxID=3694 RepID=UPI000D18AE00|nr:26S proteasome regulatory subunit RPN13 isoform X1 [Populus trichocarpa]XP_024446407.1 26S proteasome regulatory subunit RPN13 isoform X1 [Populus trichocarpa]|eukprot:XP_024446406.1 26S proteasome regulatory subunit RPN13 isoform X1 [Populus trichocarpa]